MRASKPSAPKHALWRPRFADFILAIAACLLAATAQSFAEPEGTPAGFQLAFEGKITPVLVDAGDAEVVKTTVNCFASDVELVTGHRPTVLERLAGGSGSVVVVGSMSNSQFIADLARRGLIPAERLQGKWESYLIKRVQQPFPGVSDALVIAGSDPRGAAYGVFDISKRIGVSPWYWWADVRPATQTNLVLDLAESFHGPPTVKYRGIFINDEDWGMQPWAARTMDPELKDIGPKTYARIFELLLRLRANFIWPAMHSCTKAFFYYPESPQMAARYGIVVGSSHCEPMLRNNVFEWTKNFENEYGRKPGEWRYDQNGDAIRRYWADRVKASAGLEAVYTLGMRAVHDGPMAGPKDLAGKVALLQEIFKDQRTLLAEHLRRPAAQVPQIFCPYKEVLEIYRAGLQVPDDVTLCWADDNHGYLRNLSTPPEQKRSGRSGIYYHLSYWGAPADYLWLSTISPALIGFEMHKALDHGADRLWVFNVGDLKPAEWEIAFAMELAWDANAWPLENAGSFLRQFATEIFGPELGPEIAAARNEYYLLAQRGKPEHVSRVEFGEDEMQARIQRYANLEARVQSVKPRVPERLQDAFFELVEYPLLGACLLNRVHLQARMSERLAARGDARCAAPAQAAADAYAAIRVLTERYNREICGGKWNGMMNCAPRNQEVFRMPQIATRPASGVAPAARTNEDAAARQCFLSEGRFQPSAQARLITIPGLGERGVVTLQPFDAPPTPMAEIFKAPFVECELPLSAGKCEIEVRALPTHPTYGGRALRYAISVAGDAPQVRDMEAPEFSAEWKTNVIRGYASKRTVHEVVAAGKTPVRIYLLDPGLALDEIVVNSGK